MALNIQQKATEGKAMDYSSMATSVESQHNRTALRLLKTKLEPERLTNKQQLRVAAVKAWKSICREETQTLVMPMDSRLKAAID